MFKHYLISAAMVLAVTTAAPAFAQLDKIATIRSNELVQASPQFRAGQEKMRQEFERRANDLQAEAKKLAEDIEGFKKEAELLSSADRAKKEKDLNTRKIDFEYKSRQFQEERTNRERELFADMMGKIKTVIESVASEKGLVLVVENPVYATPGIDITADVLARLKDSK